MIPATISRRAVLMGVGCALLGVRTGIAHGDDGAIRVRHSHGELTLPGAPKRIVAAGYSDLAIARALDAPLVGAMRYGAGLDGHNFPWVQPALSPEIASVPAGRVDLDLLRELEPDLILAATAYHSYGDHYDRLAEIAPTLVSVRRNLRDPYADLTRLIARLVGRPEPADRLVANADAAIAAFAERHAARRGRTIAYAQVTANSFHPIVDETALALDLFRRIGLKPLVDRADGFDCNGSFMRPLADLRSIGSADIALLAPIGKAASVRELLAPLPGAGTLPVVARGRAHIVDTHLYDALVAPNPVNIPFILARLDTILAATPRS
ncbi:ABC transporter substrate-binding protein [Bosea sp. ASV33]|uniref:ABC transporter substrate-binding protein n=1 Tax=Bosea sp. ASV33 TaxID=2795106 RepID=UPI0018EAE11C|nr:ABC transporter substrate-binding protein [Bosea sp. ASV33]